MKLRNKQTGEIYKGWLADLALEKHYSSLAELNEEWEDYEEPKEYWYIEGDGDIHHIRTELCDELEIHTMKQIGNYFETKEEAEKAVERLRAWKRLKDKGFRFEGWEMDGTVWFETKQDEQEWSPKYRDDLDLLFGDEE